MDKEWIRRVEIKHSIHGQTQILVQYSFKRYKHSAVNECCAVLIAMVLHKGLQLTIVLEAPHGWDGKTQDRPRKRRQRVMRFKGATLISVLTDGVKHYPTKPFSLSLSIH